VPSSDINLTFEDGPLFCRMELLIDGKSLAALFNGNQGKETLRLRYRPAGGRL
jgi:hypothetical protein